MQFKGKRPPESLHFTSVLNSQPFHADPDQRVLNMNSDPVMDPIQGLIFAELKKQNKKITTFCNFLQTFLQILKTKKKSSSKSYYSLHKTSRKNLFGG